MCDYVWNEVMPESNTGDDRYTVSDAEWAILRPLVSDISRFKASYIGEKCPYQITSLVPSRYMVRTSNPGVSWYCYAFINGKQLGFAYIYLNGGYKVHWQSITTEDVFEGKWGEPEWLW
jgi:hypothetical protein